MTDFDWLAAAAQPGRSAAWFARPRSARPACSTSPARLPWPARPPAGHRGRGRGRHGIRRRRGRIAAGDGHASLHSELETALAGAHRITRGARLPPGMPRTSLSNTGAGADPLFRRRTRTGMPRLSMPLGSSRAAVAIARHNDVAHVRELLGGRAQRRPSSLSSRSTPSSAMPPWPTSSRYAALHGAILVIDEASMPLASSAIAGRAWRRSSASPTIRTSSSPSPCRNPLARKVVRPAHPLQPRAPGQHGTVVHL